MHSFLYQSLTLIYVTLVKKRNICRKVLIILFSNFIGSYYPLDFGSYGQPAGIGISICTYSASPVRLRVACNIVVYLLSNLLRYHYLS